ncbi:hypothetical protein SM124_10945 [Bacillus sp. 31A1R]|uniref:Uncharacterized protein n=1 Tax=Robertmurraya mangrovi TaxID=3098077 RepID=A0ABU5IYL3_9BACI|nr:hypothetical protein [Bacillus sp. 31A1R]MDZ5472264.1 hypothetical protein [Bacillus sp. 31A1R]
MNVQMEKATLLAEQLKSFIDLVYRSYNKETHFEFHHDKVYRLKSLVDEYRFNIISEELLRVNKFVWDEKVTPVLVDRVKEKLVTIDEYVESNYQDLYLFSVRLSNIKSLLATF